MQVFKAYFKIIKKHFLQLMIYISIFLGLAILFSYSPNTIGNTDFIQVKKEVSIINKDTDSVLLTGFTDYMAQNADLVPLENTPQDLKDALFFRKTHYILTIPNGFTTAFMAGNPPPLIEDAVPDSVEAIYLSQMVNQYFNTASLYQAGIPLASQELLREKTAASLKETTTLTLDKTTIENNIPPYGHYFNFLTYAMLCVIILGVTSIMIVFNRKDIKHRNQCSPMPLKSLNFQLALATIFYGLIVWTLSVILAFFLYRITAVNLPLFLLCSLNALFMTFIAISIAFLIGLFIKNYNLQNIVTNVVALGLSFISGVFVQQDMLGDELHAIASFTPTYWYVKTNNIIFGLNHFTTESLTPIFIGMLIMVGFIIATFSVALMLSKYKQPNYL